MSRCQGNFWVWLLLLGGASSRPNPQINHEEVKGGDLITVNITEVDRKNIGLAETMGVNSLDITYPQGIQCVLRKVSSSSPGVRCRKVRVPRCRTVQRLKNTNVTEDCGRQAEYCHYGIRTQEAQEVTKETIVCERSREVTCGVELCPECPKICHQNPIVVCATEQQKVVITERKQKCGEERKLETIKICFTYPDASWVCKELRNTEDCEPQSIKVVSNEIGTPRIMCSKKEQSPICIPSHCTLNSNYTHCLTTQLPVEVDLEDFECEECSHGRTKERQVLVQEEECKEVIQEFCVDNEDEASEWVKTCRVPSSTQPDQLAEILRENTNPLNDPRSLQTDGLDSSNGILFHGPVRDEYIGIKPTKNDPQSDDTITNMIEGADIFFAKQFFKNTFSESTHFNFSTKVRDTHKNVPTFIVTEPPPLTTGQTTRNTIKQQSPTTEHTTVKQITNKPFATKPSDITPKPKPKDVTTKQTTEEYTTKASTATQSTEKYTTKASISAQVTEEYTTKFSSATQAAEDYTTKEFIILPQTTTQKSISIKPSTTSPEYTETEYKGITNNSELPINTISPATRAYTVLTTPNPTKRTSTSKYPEDPIPTFASFGPFPTFGPITTEETVNSGVITTAKNIENESSFINDPEEGISCLRSRECPSGQQCISGSCEIACQNDLSCPSGKSCVNSHCVDHCSNEESCGVNAQCIRHNLATYCSCIPGFIGIPTPREGCVRSQHSCAIVQCPVGYKCEKDHCHYQCQESRDCAVGEVCLNEKCAKICSSDQHCLIGEFCSKELVCKIGCNEDENCHDNQLCLNKKCVTIGRENVETTTDDATRFSRRPTIKVTPETTPSITATNNKEESGNGSGIYFDPNLPFHGVITNQLTTEGSPTIGVHSRINDPTVGIHAGNNNEGHRNSNFDICSNVKCPLGYRCEQGECLSIQSSNEDDINPGGTKDNTKEQENNKDHCLKVRCPVGYRCNTGQCYIYNRQNYTGQELEEMCSNVKCPIGYRCHKGDCLTLENHIRLDCVNVLCPDGHKCERGHCYKELSKNDHNSNPDTCKNVECPNGYRCHRGQCVDKSVGSFRDDPRNIDNFPTDCKDVKCPLGYQCERGRCVNNDIPSVDHDITIDDFDRDDFATNNDHIHNAGTSSEHRHHAHTGQNHGLHKHKTRFEKKQDSANDLNDLLLLLGGDVSVGNIDSMDTNDDKDDNKVTNIESANDNNKELHEKGRLEKANMENNKNGVQQIYTDVTQRNKKITFDEDNVPNNNEGQQSFTSETQRNLNRNENEAKNLQNNDQTGLLFLPFTDPLLKRENSQGNQPKGNAYDKEGNYSITGKQQYNTEDNHKTESKDTNFIAQLETDDQRIRSSIVGNTNPRFTENNEEYRAATYTDSEDIFNSENKNQIIRFATFENKSKNIENQNNQEQETNSEHVSNIFQSGNSNDLASDYEQIITEGNTNGNEIKNSTDKVNPGKNANVNGITNAEVVNDNNHKKNQTTDLLFHPLTEEFLTRTSTEHPNKKHFNFGNEQKGNNIISEGEFEIHRGTSEQNSGQPVNVLEEKKPDKELFEKDTNCELIQNEKERITCKVISCFKHRDNCFR